MLLLVCVFVMLIFAIWKVSFIFWIDGFCVVLLALVVITIMSRIFHPLLRISSRNDIYFLVFLVLFYVRINH